MERRGIVLDLDDWHYGWPSLLNKAKLNVLGLHNWGPEHLLNAKIDKMIRYFQSEEGKKTQHLLSDSQIELEFELHAMSWLLPRSLFYEHPHWFRMDEQGNRTPNDNFCPSSKEALEVVGTNAVKLAGLLKPTTGRYSMWQDDNKPWCCCDKCRFYTASDQNLLVMNAIMEAIRTVDRNAKLSYLAYAATLELPPEKVKPNEGVFLEITGPVIHRMKEANPQGAHSDEQFQLALARNLQVFGSEHAQALDYWLDVSLQARWKKPVNELRFDETAAAKDIAYYKSQGIHSVSSFGVFLDEAYFRKYGEPPVEAYGRLLL
ncbi:DUF4838 domain-containing protein [Paenibacillus sp. MBLB4367]|uniref:DUF4838 domain-containing protein n=1 Tax=Paenibacillus sp. MBLB4367 TaxID=3384767 RepID=UPI003908127B